jgi:hypothetical protein
MGRYNGMAQRGKLCADRFAKPAHSAGHQRNAWFAFCHDVLLLIDAMSGKRRPPAHENAATRCADR